MSVNRKISDELNKHLAAYLNLGLPIIPVCPPTEKGMPEALKQRKKTLGKTPLIKGWPQRTTTTIKEVRKWLIDFPNCNFGLPTGNASGLIGIDVDGEAGERILQEWSKGDLPPTWTFLTHSGIRLLYALPQGIMVKKIKEVDEQHSHSELALLGDGQQTVVPPSVHTSGFIYQWKKGLSPWDLDMPSLAPNWIIKRMTAPAEAKQSEPVTQDEWKKQLNEGSRNNQIIRLAGSLAAKGNLPRDAILGALKEYNQKNCSPPLPDEELHRAVDFVMLSEASKKEQAKDSAKRGKTRFLPAYIAKQILLAEKQKGLFWAFSVQFQCFFLYKEDEGYWKRMVNHYVNARIRGYIVATEPEWESIHHVREIYEAMAIACAEPTEYTKFDAGTTKNSKYINLQNGMFNCDTASLELHSPDFYSVNQIPSSYDPKATCTRWLEALEAWVPEPETRQFLQEYIGYCLTTDTGQKVALLLNGSGNNGKSLFLYGITALIGKENYSAMPLNSIGDRFGPATIRNKLLNACDELDGVHLQGTGILKAIISGDPIRGEEKFGANFFFTPVSKLLFTTNALPTASDQSEGWYNRLRIIDFDQKFATDPKYVHFMHDAIHEELPGILNWAIQGLLRLRKNGSFTKSDLMDKTHKAYEEENDSTALFRNECLEEDAASNLPTKTVYAFYRYYAQENGLRPVSSRQFGQRMKREYETGSRKVAKGTNAYCYIGLRICQSVLPDYNLVNSLHG